MIDIKEKEKCCGCSACASICPKECIDMITDEEGFLYPKVNNDICINCNLCEAICPILNCKEEETFEQDGYIVQNKNEQVLRESTSGGAFTAIAAYVLRKKGVVFGVELTEQLEAHHIYIENEDELYKFRNSKYIQSNVGMSYKEAKSFLEQGRFVCFSGTPCQIEGLKKYLKKDYENLITVDVVCRAVPSPLIFKKYIELQENVFKEKILKVRFRDKYYGYKYSTLNIVSEKNNGSYHEGIDSDPWLRAFFSNICDRPSCHKCKFRKIYRVSDITIWDCLNVWEFSKELDNDKGATRVLIHSDKAKKVFEEIKRDFNYIKIAPQKLIKDVAEVKRSVPQNERRREFFRDAHVLSGTQLFEKYFPNTFKVRAEHKVRLLCHKLGIYSVGKKLFIKIFRK